MVMNKIRRGDVLLSYLNFSEYFIIHTDAIKMQTGILSSRRWEFHCILLTQDNHCLINYTTTLIKMLSIVETLLKLRTIILGYTIANIHHISHTSTLKQIYFQVGA